MFKETSDNAYYSYILCLTFNARNKTAYSSYCKFNFYASLWCFNQTVNYCFIRERINLYSNIRLFTAFSKFNLFLYHFNNTILQAVWCNKECIWIFHCCVSCKSLEYLVSVFTDFPVCCHKWQISVKTRCFFVIVSCSYLCIIFRISACFLSYKTEFWVHLKSVKSVNHSTSCGFKSSWPLYVIFLIKPCLQFNKYKYILTVFSCFYKCIYNFTVFSNSV